MSRSGKVDGDASAAQQVGLCAHCLTQAVSAPFVPASSGAVDVRVRTRAAGTGRATFFDRVLTPESTWIPTESMPEPLFGMLRIEIDDLAAAAATSLRIVALDVTGGGLPVRLDDTIASPGSGVRVPDGSVVIPTSFVIVDAGAPRSNS